MAPSVVGEREIDKLIWGNLGSEIIEAEFPLYVAYEVIKSAKVYPVKLLIGFLDFIHYKFGLEPKFSGNDKLEFDAIGGDFDDHSSWAEFLGVVADKEIVQKDPYFCRRFVDQNGSEHEIVILMNTFSFFECGMILNKTRLEGESRFSADEISREFHVYERKLPHMLSYFKDLSNAGQAREHTLVLRPTKLAKMLYWLDDERRTLTNCPKRVLRTEEWEEATSTPKGEFRMHNELYSGIDCNEENFRELLKVRSIEIPHARFRTFYEHVRDILTPEAAKEWEDIRDRYITESKRVLKQETPGFAHEDLERAKALLGKAREAFEEERYVESVISSNNAMEEALSKMIKQDMDLSNKINVATGTHPDLRKYKEVLHFIRTTRNKLGHPSGVDECDAADAEFALEKMDQFLISVTDSLRSRRLDE